MFGTQEVPGNRPSQKELRKQKRKAERRSRDHKRSIKKVLTRAGIGVVAAIGLGWLGYSIATAKRLPPTDMNNQAAERPTAQLFTKPMPIAVQRHVREHADGRRRPGVVFNYNCRKFR